MKLSVFLLLCASLAAFAADGLNAGKPDPAAAGMNPERLAMIPARMREFVDAGKTAGVVTIVARHGHVASFEAVGYQDLERKIPMRTDTIFRIMSMTKPVTSAAIMILVDEGRIALIDPVEKYLPEFTGLRVDPCAARAGSYNCELHAPLRPVNIQDLMTHTSGLPGTAPHRAGTPVRTLAEAVAAVSGVSLLFEPGTSWNYSQIGYEALGRIVEVVSGESFDRFVTGRILVPLGMNDTFFFIPPGKESRIAAAYRYEPDGLKRVETPVSPYPTPQGGLFSTALDMLRFHQMMLNRGTLDGHRVLSAAAVESMTTSWTGPMEHVGFAPGVGHGFGFEVVRDASGTFRYNSIGSYVKGGAYRTYGWVDPAKDLTGVLMMQRTNGGGDTADEINRFLAMAAGAVER